MFGTQNAGFTASLLIPAEDFQDTLKLLHGRVIYV